MYVSNEQIAATNLAGMQAAAGFAQVQFSAFERLYALSFNATKSSLEEGAGYLRALLDARDMPQCLELSIEYGQPAIEKAFSYTRSYLEVGTHARDQMTRLLEAQATDINRKTVAGLTRLANYAPGGTEVAVTAMKTAFEAADNMLSAVTADMQDSMASKEPKPEAPTTAASESEKKAA